MSATLFLMAMAAFAAPVSGTARVHGSGDPVAGLTLRVDGADAGVVTDARGRFNLDLPEGEHELLFESIDYERVEVTLSVPVAEPVDVFLEPTTGYEVVVESFRETANTTRHVVDAEMALETPGTLEDSVRLVQSLPGVSVQREYSPGQADLSVRGSSPGENRYYLDGVEVPYLYHFNQYASVFPTNQIDTLELFPSTFSSAYGDAVGAIIDARSVQKRPDALHGGVGVSTVMVSGSVLAPLKEDGGWWVSASGRRSYADLASDATAQYPIWPIFGDFSARAGKGSEDRSVQLFAWGANDAYARAAGELDLLDPAEAQVAPSFEYHRGFQVAGVQVRRATEQGSREHVFAYVHDRLRGELTSNGSELLEESALTHRTRVARTLHDGLRLEGGGELRAGMTRLAVVDPGFDAALVSSEAPALARGVPVDASLGRVSGALHGEAHLYNQRLRFMPGVRLPVDSERLLLPEPRLAVRWRAGEQTALKLAGGWYQQLPRTEHLFERTDVLSATTSWQASAGVEQTVAGRLELNLDTYAKELSHPWVVPPDAPIFAVDKGHAWGVELVARYRLRETFFVWSWLAVARTFTQAEAGGELVPASGDQPISAGVVASWTLSHGWNIGFRWRYGSGLPYTPADGSIYDAGRDQWAPLYGAVNSERFPAYQKYDLHIERNIALRRWSLALYVEGWYVPKRSAQLYPTWNYDYREQGWVMGPTFLPLLGGRATF